MTVTETLPHLAGGEQFAESLSQHPPTHKRGQRSERNRNWTRENFFPSIHISKDCTETHEYVGEGEIDEVDVGGCLHVRVGQNHDQDDDVADHSNHQDRQVTQDHQCLDCRQEDDGLVLITDWSE